MTRFKKGLIYLSAILWFIWAVIIAGLVFFSQLIEHLNNS